jgi:hypothetical protein
MWAAEMMALPRDATPEDWLASQPGGERWAIHKTGTCRIERAAHASGFSAADMVVTPTDEIVQMAMGAELGSTEFARRVSLKIGDLTGLR